MYTLRNLIPIIFLFCLVIPPVLWAETPTRKEAEQFGQALQEAVLKRDPDFLNSSMDLPRFVDRVLKRNVPGTQKARLRKIIMAGFKPTRLLLPQLAKHDYRYLRTIVRDGQMRVLFRMLAEDGAVNYHEYLLEKNDGKLKYTDIYIYLSGEQFSATLGRLLLASGHRTEQLKIIQSFKMQEYARTVQLFKKSSAYTRSEKTFQLIALQAAMHEESDHNYLELMENYRMQFPSDPSLALIEIDYFYINGNIPRLEKTILQLDQYLEGDPYLMVLLAAALSEKGRTQDALEYLGKAIVAQPDFPLTYLGKINIHISQKDYAAAVGVLKDYQVQFGHKAIQKVCEELEADQSNQEFVRSRIYQEFRPPAEKTMSI